MSKKCKDKCRKGEVTTLKFEDMQIIVTLIGGSFLKEHTIYIVRQDQSVFKTKDFELNNLNTLDAQYIGKIKSMELDNVEKKVANIPEAIEIKAYKKENNNLNLKYKGYLGFGNKPKIITNILSLDF